MKIRSFFVVILLSLFIFPCSCKTDIDTMILDYGSKYGHIEDNKYDLIPGPGDLYFEASEMLLDVYYFSEDSSLQIPCPPKCRGWRWEFTYKNSITHEIERAPLTVDSNTLSSELLFIEKPLEVGFEIGKTYYLTLTVYDNKGGRTPYKDRAVVIIYEKY